jgi:hypothetical protein
VRERSVSFSDQTPPVRPSWLVMKSMLFGLMCAISVAACGSSPHETEDGGVVDAPGPDAPGRDARPEIDAPAPSDAGIDAAPIDGPPIDAPPIDARPIDAPPIDAPPIDAGAADPFTVTLSPPPIVPRTSSGSALVQMATVTNNLTRRLNVDFSFTGGFSEAGRCTNIQPQATCTLTAAVDISTLGVRTGTLALGGGGLRKTVPITATVQPYVAGHAETGQGTVTLSPAESPGCVQVFGGCYPEGTQVTATAVAAPNFAFAGWNAPQCGTAPTCTVTAGLEPIQLGALFAPIQVAVEVEITGGLGEVVVVDLPGTGGGVCLASCTVTVTAGPMTAFLTTPGHILSVDGVPTHIDGALERDYPMGTSAIAAEFGGEPGEVELLADDAEFGPSNELALRVGGTITVYDAAMIAQWSAPGDKMAFTPTGELYIQDGPAHTTKYASTGTVLLAANTALGFVTPSGGMLVPGPASNQFSILDASLAVVATRTIRGQFGGELAGCVGQDDHEIWASGHLPGNSTSTFNIFNLAGDLTFDADRDWHNCHTHPTYHGDFVFSTFAIVEASVTFGDFHLDDLTVFTTAGDAFDAAVDGSDHLYWTYAPNDDDIGPTKSVLAKYVPPSQTPVWTLTRLPDFNRNGGIEPFKLAAAPDGRVAWTVRWFHPLATPTRAVLVFPADFAGPASNARAAPAAPRR